MQDTLIVDRDLIARYDRLGPRYTSYPTAMQFHEGFGCEQYVENAGLSNEDPVPAPLSLYFHLPFCNRVCYYCACNKIITKNRAHTEGYLADLKKEIELQSRLFDPDRVVEQLHWGGGTPTFFSCEQMQDLMDETRARFNIVDDDTGDFSIEVDPREADPETIARLREIGFNRISLGIQDFNPDVQKAVNRIQPVEQTHTIISAVREQAFKSLSVDLIYGLPLQSVDTFQDTLEKIIALDPDRISTFNYAHLPERFKTQRQINDADLPNPAEKLAMLEQIINTLTGAGYVFIGMDHFAKPDDELVLARKSGELCRNFQGYSTHGSCDIIGMGITAISKIGDCYAQNVYTLDEYHSIIDSGKYPTFRGIKLDFDDLIRRDVIMRLICDFRLAIDEVEDKYKLGFEDYFYNELHFLDCMQEDGLLTRSFDKITILPPGRLLIRNICSVFDKYLRQQQEPPRYSKVI